MGFEARSEAIFSYVPGEDDLLTADSDPYGDHAEPKSVTDHYRWRVRVTIGV